MFGDVNLLLIFPHADVLPISIKTPQHFSFLFPFPLCTLFIVKMKLWFRFICRLTHQIPIWFLVSPLSYSQAVFFFLSCIPLFFELTLRFFQNQSLFILIVCSLSAILASLLAKKKKNDNFLSFSRNSVWKSHQIVWQSIYKKRKYKEKEEPIEALFETHLSRKIRYFTCSKTSTLFLSGCCFIERKFSNVHFVWHVTSKLL